MQLSPAQFTVHPSSGVPIYRQLIEQVQALVVGGRALPGDMLPSVRELGAALGVNMMTVSKAYARLEADGTLERARGKGMVVREQQHSGSITSRVKELKPHAEQFVIRGRQLGLGDDQLVRLIERVLAEQPAIDIHLRNDHQHSD